GVGRQCTAPDHKAIRQTFLFYRSENSRCVVSDSDGESGVRTEVGKTFDTGEIETQSRGFDLHAESRFCLRLRAEWTISRSRVRPPVNLAGDAELFVYTENACKPVSQHVVLSEEFGWRGENRDTEIAKCIEASVSAKLLTHEDLPECVCLIKT